MTLDALAWKDGRAVGRDEVHYRARAFGPDAQPLVMLIVNISAMGLMTRCDAGYAVGDRLRITLPVVGVVVAEIRWSLGGTTGSYGFTGLPSTEERRVGERGVM